MSLTRVNLVNIGLMLLSLGIALVLPFETFLFAYAVLGPLHYLTQISWLGDRRCFTQNPRDWWPLLGLGIVITAITLGATTQPYWYLAPLAFSLFLFSFGLAFLLAVARDRALRVTGIVVLTAVTLLFHGSRGTYVLFGLYMPTLIHVFVFTGAFVLYGALKNRSRSAYASLLVFLGCGLAALFLDVGALGYQGGDHLAEAYQPFRGLHLHFLHLVGLADNVANATGSAGDLAPFTSHAHLFSDPASLQVGRFIAFAYTYHYLNWFSKTSVIRWHEVPRARLVAVIVLWLASVSLYAADYSLGIRWLLFLSLLHVLLEFPLNWKTLLAIAGELWQRVRPLRAAGT